jgi:hypothetical protein
MVRYKVKSDRVAENEASVRAVFDELHREHPSGFRYASFKDADGVSFVHMVFEEGGGDRSLAEFDAFKAFVAGVNDRCEIPPSVTELTEVGSYRLHEEVAR